MKRKKNAALLIAGIIVMFFFASICVSCISEDTAYRVGYDIGSSLSYQEKPQTPHADK